MHMKFFSCFCIRKYQKCDGEFSYWLRVIVLWFKSMSFFNHWQDRHSSFYLKTKEPNFFWYGSFFEYQFENCNGSFVAKLMSVRRIFSDCPNQPNLPRQLKTYIAFSIVPILNTNLCCRPYHPLFWLLFYLQKQGKLPKNRLQ